MGKKNRRPSIQQSPPAVFEAPAVSKVKALPPAEKKEAEDVAASITAKLQSIPNMSWMKAFKAEDPMRSYELDMPERKRDSGSNPLPEPEDDDGPPKVEWPDPNSPMKLYFAKATPRPAYTRRPTIGDSPRPVFTPPTEEAVTQPEKPSATQLGLKVDPIPALPSKPQSYRQPTIEGSDVSVKAVVGSEPDVSSQALYQRRPTLERTPASLDTAFAMKTVGAAKCQYSRRPTLGAATFDSTAASTSQRNRRPTLKDLLVTQANESHTVDSTTSPTLTRVISYSSDTAPRGGPFGKGRGSSEIDLAVGTPLPTTPFLKESFEGTQEEKRYSSETDADLEEYLGSSPLPGNAFASPKFWEDLGKRTPKHEDESMEKQVDKKDIARAKAFEESEEEIGNQEIGVLEELRAAATTPAEAANATAASFANPNFWRSMSVRVKKHANEKHPFPTFAVQNDPRSREAYENVRDMLIAYWFSEIAVRGGSPTKKRKKLTPKHTPKASVTSVGSFSPPSSPTKAPTSTTSPFGSLRRLATNMSLTSLIPRDDEESEAPSKVSAMPGSLKGKKKAVQGTPMQDQSWLRAKDLTVIVLAEIQDAFSHGKHLSLGSYVKNKPKSIAKKMDLYEKAETEFIRKLSIKPGADLADSSTWKVAKDPLNPALDDFESVFDQQSRALNMLHKRMMDEVMAVPLEGYRVLWATKFAEWATAHYDEQLGRMLALKALSEGMDMGVEGDTLDDTEDAPDFDDEKGEKGEKGKKKEQEDVGGVEESETKARKRRRATQFNMGFQAPVAQRSSAPEDDVGGWEHDLRAALTREKERQRMWVETKEDSKHDGFEDDDSF